MRLLLVCVLAVGVAGCQSGFGRGFTDEAIRQVADGGVELAVGALEEKLGDKIDGIGEVIAGIPGKIPLPEQEDPGEKGLWYTGGALLAYLIGSVGKGWFRTRMKPPAEA